MECEVKNCKKAAEEYMLLGGEIGNLVKGKHLYCKEHATKHGFCKNCGCFGGHPSGYCMDCSYLREDG